MEEIGNIREYDDVKRVYGDKSLEEALNNRRSDILWLGDIINKVINRDKNISE